MALMLLRFLAVMFTAIDMAAGFTHLLELPNKMPLSRADYLVVQQIYRGWALLGVVVLGALVTSGIVALQVRARPAQFYLTLAATACIALSLLLFFIFTYPANQETQNWTILPDNWESLRRQWEYSHAAGAGLSFLALSALTLSLLLDRPGLSRGKWRGAA
jgi:hypothetical protein